jgi:hypothetical protein
MRTIAESASDHREGGREEERQESERERKGGGGRERAIGVGVDITSMKTHIQYMRTHI